MSTTFENITYFDRQIRLAEVGEIGQIKIRNTSVLVIGAGGLGNPAIQYLAAAGIGKIGIVDFDAVEESNLHRQLLFSMQDLGQPKTIVSSEKLRTQFPHTEFNSYPLFLSNELAISLFPLYDILLDCTDRISTRYLINDACFLLNKVWIYGSVNGFSGQWAIFNHSQNPVQYRDIFPAPPLQSATQRCDTHGTIGVIPGFTGVMQAAECLKVILGSCDPGKLHTFDLMDNRFYSMNSGKIKVHDQPRTAEDYLLFSYPSFCGDMDGTEIKPADLLQLLNSKNILIIDVREEDELPVCRLKQTAHIPLALLEISSIDSKGFDVVVTLCQSGTRSKKAQEILLNKYNGLTVLNLTGGMNELSKYVDEWK